MEQAGLCVAAQVELAGSWPCLKGQVLLAEAFTRVRDWGCGL